MVTLKEILSDAGKVINTKGLKLYTIARYRHHFRMIAFYLPRQPKYSGILSEGVNTEMDEKKFEQFLEIYLSASDEIQHLRNITANYMRRSFKNISQDLS